MKTLLLSATLMLGLAGQSWAADRTNYDIYKDVTRQVTGYAFFTIFDNIRADVSNGVVTLTGKVTMPFKSRDLEKRVAKVAGVTAVRNRIEALPASQMDDQLRLSLARALYANPALQMYGLGANPSIHVIVEHGRVTLTGVVGSNVDRMLARTLATHMGALSVTSELKTDAEVQDALEKSE